MLEVVMMDSLRVWRTRRLLTQNALAEKAGVSPSTVAAIEEGRYLPRLLTIQKIAQALSADPSEVEEFAKAIERWGRGGAE